MATQTTTAPVKSATPAKAMMKIINSLVAPLLRSPLHGLLGGKMMLITLTGRKSGRQITTPVSYIPDGDGVLLFTAGMWWKNLRDGAPVTLRLKGRDVPAFATADPDPETTAREVERFFQMYSLKDAWRI